MTPSIFDSPVHPWVIQPEGGKNQTLHEPCRGFFQPGGTWASKRSTFFSGHCLHLRDSAVYLRMERTQEEEGLGIVDVKEIPPPAGRQEEIRGIFGEPCDIFIGN